LVINRRKLSSTNNRSSGVHSFRARHGAALLVVLPFARDGVQQRELGANRWSGDEQEQSDENDLHVSFKVSGRVGSSLYARDEWRVRMCAFYVVGRAAGWQG
jgi:hypothetical protein